MAAANTLTYEHDDAALMAAELLSGVDCARGRIGFLACNAQANHAGLVPCIQEAVSFPVVGGTSLASPFHDARDDVAAGLVVLSKDDMAVHVALSPPITEEGGSAAIARLFDECREGLGCEPKLYLVFIPVFPFLAASRYLPEVYARAGRTPVFGGMVSDDFQYADFAVFGDGGGFRDRMALVALGGDVRPVTSVNSQLTILSDYEPTVTEARGTEVYRVDDMTFCDYLRKLGFHDGLGVSFEFPLSVLVKGRLSKTDGVPEVNILTGADNERGCGIFATPIPEGTQICVGMLNREDVTDSAYNCLRDAARMMAAERRNGYEFSMVFCVSCLSRYFSMVGQVNLEAEAIRRELPKAVPSFGYYAFNEVCPTRDAGGGCFNRAHGDSLAVCAF